MRGFISHLDLNVANPPKSIAFYSLVLGHLGFRREPLDEPARAWWSLTYADGSQFGIEVRAPREAAPSDRHERYSPGIDHLAFQADSREDVDALYGLLTEAGYTVADPPALYDYAPDYYAVAFDDPDGIRLEVVYHPTRDG